MLWTTELLQSYRAPVASLSRRNFIILTQRASPARQNHRLKHRQVLGNVNINWNGPFFLCEKKLDISRRHPVNDQ